MATARPGWSRRAQYGLFFSFLAVIAGIVVGLILLALSLVAPKTFERVRGAALDVTGPVAGALHEVTATAAGLVTGAGNYWDAAQPERRAQARAHGDAAADGRGQGDLPGEPAAQGRAPAARAQPRRGRGRPDRRLVVQQPAPLRDPVGRLQRRRARSECRCARPTGSSAGSSTPAQLGSRVLLVSDRANIVPARLLRSGIPVIAQGRGDGTIDVRPLEVGRNPFKRGDIIITSGTGGLYPPLVPIARVVKLDDDGAVALPLADPATISFAIVEPPFEPAAVAADAAARAGRALMVRAALASEAPDRPGPAPLRRCRARRDGRRRLACSPRLPIVSTSGWYPDFGFLVLISWRLLRADPVAGLVGRAAGLRQRPVHRISDRLFNRFVERDDAGARSDRPPHDVARLLDRMGACGGADRDRRMASVAGRAGRSARALPFTRMLPPLSSRSASSRWSPGSSRGSTRWRLGR